MNNLVLMLNGNDFMGLAPAYYLLKGKSNIVSTGYYTANPMPQQESEGDS